MEYQAVKPPPIRISAEGIAPKPVELTPPRIDWPRLVTLPPFQMFAAERMRNTSRHDAEQHANNFLNSRGLGQDVLDEYMLWHAWKGYWPNETPLGMLKRKE